MRGVRWGGLHHGPVRVTAPSLMRLRQARGIPGGRRPGRARSRLARHGGPPRLTWVGLCLLSVLGGSSRAIAQTKEGFDDRALPDEPETRLDSLAQEHMVHVSPHVLVFNARSKTATLSFRNQGPYPVQGEVQVLFAYLAWPHGHPADTTVFTAHMATIEPRDTVVLKPSPKDPFAGRWLSGVPARVTLAPHETKRITVRLTPPTNLPAGEYWARIVALVRPQDQPRKPGAQDVRQHYALPIQGALTPLRDSALVFYRQGPLRTGLAVGAGAAAQYDVQGIGGPDGRDCPHSLWIKLPLHLTGNTHADGILTVTYRNVETSELVPVNRYTVPLYRDAVTHWWTHTCWVAPGTYQAILGLQSDPHALPRGAQLPFAPLLDTLPTPFVITH